MNNKTTFWNKIAKKYAASPVADQVAYDKKLQITRNYFKPNMQVLEIGCGTGTTALSHAPFVQHIHAIDFAHNMIEIGKEKAKSLGIDNVIFENKDVEELSKTNESYDVIMAHSLIHLVDDKQALINKAYELLKPGGVFVSSTVCLSGFFVVLKYIWPIISRLGGLPMVKFFSSQTLIENHISAGFIIDYQWEYSSKGIFIVAQKTSKGVAH